MIIQWHLTERCNIHCTHCYQEAGAKELPFEALIKTLDQVEFFYRELCARQNRKVKLHLNISGGEPFLRKDFFQFLDAVFERRSQMSFAVLSNGMLINERVAEMLREREARYVQVSIEGVEHTHNAIRGPGTYHKAVKGIQELVAAGVQTLISFTAHRQNWREFSSVAQLGRELGVHYVWSDRLIPHGNGAQLRNQVMSATETKSFFELMRREQKQSSPQTKIRMHRALQFLVGGTQTYHCTAGDSLLTIMSNGDVTPCRRMPVVVGNVLQSSLSELYFNAPLLKSLRKPSIPEGCEGCFHALQCRGGLKCLSMSIHGRMDIADPGCWVAGKNGEAEVDDEIAASLAAIV